MKKIKRIYKVIQKVAKNDEFLHSGEIDHMNLVYPLQKLGSEDWNKFYDLLSEWTQEELRVLANALIVIGDNKISNFDSSALYGRIFILCNYSHAMDLLEHFDFIDNELPKDVIFIDNLSQRLRQLEGETQCNTDFTSEFKLIYQLYNKAVS